MHTLRCGLWTGLLILLCRPLLAQHDPDALAYFDKGFACGKAGNWKDAAANYRFALLLAPHWYEAEVDLGNAYIHLGQYAEAVPICQDVVKNHSHSEQGYTNLGLSYIGLQQWIEAEHAFDKALQVAPNSAVSNYERGCALLKQNRIAEGMHSLEKTVLLKPDWPQAHLGLGLAYVAVGDREAAQRQYDTLSADEPEKANTLRDAMDADSVASMPSPHAVPAAPEADNGSAPSAVPAAPEDNSGSAGAMSAASSRLWEDFAGKLVFRLLFALPAAWFAHNRRRSPILWGLLTLFSPISLFFLPIPMIVILLLPKRNDEALDRRTSPGAGPSPHNPSAHIPVMPVAGEQELRERLSDRAGIRNTEVTNRLPDVMRAGGNPATLATEIRRRERPTFRSVRQVQFPRDLLPDTELALEQAAIGADGRIHCQRCGRELAAGEGAAQHMRGAKHVWDALGWNLPRDQRTYLFNRMATEWWCLCCQRQEGREMIYGRQPYTREPGPDHSNEPILREEFEEA